MSVNNKLRQHDTMTLARALTLAALLLEFEVENNAHNRAWQKECREATAILRREAEARQVDRPNYEGVHIGVS